MFMLGPQDPHPLRNLLDVFKQYVLNSCSLSFSLARGWLWGVGASFGKAGEELGRGSLFWIC